MNNFYLSDRILHWVSAAFILYMLMVISTELHTVDWQIKGQISHRQDAVQSHAFIGILLIVLTMGRLLLSKFFGASLTRTIPKSSLHKQFIKITHALLYLTIITLFVTGFAMIMNYDIPLIIYGVDLAPDSDRYYSIAVEMRDIHLKAKTLLWWLIGIHLVGFLYSKK